MTPRPSLVALTLAALPAAAAGDPFDDDGPRSIEALVERFPRSLYAERVRRWLRP